MERERPGYYLKTSTIGEVVQSFIPSPLPPEPPIVWSAELHEKFDQALLAVGRLDSVSMLLPETSLFLYMYVRQEAVLSSQIEGTQSSLLDLLLFEAGQQPGVPLDDVQEVSNYVSALNYGLKRLSEGFPISLRLVKEIHAILLQRHRGEYSSPGEFRKTQNWIGGTRPGNAAFVPPPANQVLECMGQLELFLHNQPQPTPTLLKAALAHLQFETIHPFLDGNGRLGRLLIPLILHAENMMKEPLLYLSLYFKTHRQRYYDLLNHVRLTGDWESWLEFFAEAVATTATQAVRTAQDLVRIAAEDRKRIESLGRVAGSVLQVYEPFLLKPIASVRHLSERLTLTPATINTSLKHLQQLGIILEMTGKKRDRLYSYMQYIDIMNQSVSAPL